MDKEMMINGGFIGAKSKVQWYHNILGKLIKIHYLQRSAPFPLLLLLSQTLSSYYVFIEMGIQWLVGG